MKNLKLVVLFIGVVVWGGCDDQIIETYTANVPIYMTYEELRESVEQESSRELEKPGKIYFYNDYLFINEYLEGIHIIDNSNPSSPQNLGFIEIPGNVDIAVKDDILYADSYVDLIALDISDLNNITEIKRLQDVFPYILPPYDENYRVDDIDYTKGIVVDWELKKVTKEIHQNNYPVFPWYDSADYLASSYSNGTSGYSSSASSFGVGGSMARFSGKENALYTIDSYNLKVIDIETVEDIYVVKTISVGWNIETLFPTGNNLFIGSQNGMFIYDISNPYDPTYISDYWHMTSCDPVVVHDTCAFITLRSDNLCRDADNQLDVIGISDLSNPNYLKSYSMTNPHGLGIDNSTLFVCDGDAGLKIYDATDPLTIGENLIAHFPDIQTYDVIPVNGILMLIGDDGLYQYDYSDLENIRLLSSITISN